MSRVNNLFYGSPDDIDVAATGSVYFNYTNKITKWSSALGVIETITLNGGRYNGSPRISKIAVDAAENIYGIEFWLYPYLVKYNSAGGFQAATLLPSFPNDLVIDDQYIYVLYGSYIEIYSFDFVLTKTINLTEIGIPGAFEIAVHSNGDIFLVGEDSTTGNMMIYRLGYGALVPDPPNGPTNLTATFASPNNIYLYWQDNSTDETSFYIKRKFGIRGVYQYVGLASANSTVYIDTTASNVGEYIYVIEANHSLNGKSVYSNEASVMVWFPFEPYKTSVFFGRIPDDSSKNSEIFTIKNYGSNQATVNLSISGINADEFILNKNCPAILNPTESCTFSATYNPSATTRTGQSSASLDVSVTSPTGATSTTSIALSAESYNPPEIVMSVFAMHFGRVDIDSGPVTKQLIISNVGKGALVFNNISIEYASYMSITSSSCTTTTSIAPGGNCYIDVTFNPLKRGDSEGFLRIESNDPRKENILMGLSGYGYGVAYTITPSSHDFGAVNLYSSSKPAIFKLTGKDSAYYKVSVQPDSRFYKLYDSCSDNLIQKDKTCEIIVTFEPDYEQPYSIGLLIQQYSPDWALEFEQSVPLTGEGILPALNTQAFYALQPSEIEFPNMDLLVSSAPEILTLVNYGPGPLEIYDVTHIVGSSKFSILFDSCSGTVLEAGDICTIGVKFKTSTYGTFTGELLLFTSDNLHPFKLVPIQGKATTTKTAVAPTAYDFGSIEVGETTGSVLFWMDDGYNYPWGSPPDPDILALLPGLIKYTIYTTSSDFEIVSNNCTNRTIFEDGLCPISIKFSPQAEGRRYGTLVLEAELTTYSGTITETKSVPLYGSGLPKSIKVDPDDHYFGTEVWTVTTEYRTFTLTNGSKEPLSINNVKTSNNNFKIKDDTCEGTTVPVGGTCTVKAAFAPTYIGDIFGSLIFESDDYGGAVAKAGLHGKSYFFYAVAIPSWQDFGKVEVGTESETRTIKIYNQINNIFSTATFEVKPLDGDFNIVSDGCAGKIVLGTYSCNIGVSFTPSGVGRRTANLHVDYYSGGDYAGELVVAVSGDGFIVPDLSVSPESHLWESVLVGGYSETKAFVVKNESIADINLAGASIISEDQRFELVSDSCSNSTLAPGTTCQIEARLHPDTSGYKSADIVLPTSSLKQPELHLNLEAYTTVRYFSSVDPVSIDFGDLYINHTSSIRTIILTAGVNLTGKLNAIMQGDGFEIVEDGCSGIDLIQGDVCQLKVTFNPLEAREYSGGIELQTCNYYMNAEKTTCLPQALMQVAYIDLAGNGKNEPDIAVSKTSYDLGPVKVGNTSAPGIIVISNDGSGDLEISDIGPMNNNHGMTAELMNCSSAVNYNEHPVTVIPPSGTCELVATFTPGKAETSELTLTIQSNDPDMPRQDIVFTGTGYEKELVITPDRFDFGDVYAGMTSAPETFIVENVSATAVIVSSVEVPDSVYFEIAVETCTSTPVSPGGTCTIDVVFHPASLLGNITGTLRVVSADPALGSFDAELTGNARELKQNTVTVSVRGQGLGTVTSSPSGIDCGDTCRAQFDADSVVTLTATPSSGYVFEGWSGRCSGTGDCVLTMDRDMSVTATFQ